MKKWILLLILAIGLFGCSGCKDQKGEASDPCPEKTKQIVSLQAQVKSLQGQISTLTAENATLKSQSENILAITTENAKLKGDLIDCLKTKVAKASSGSGKSATGAGTSKTNTQPATGTSGTPANRTKAAIIPTPGNPSNANLNGLRENGIISFCVMANGDSGLHFPQKALDKGVTFTSIESNPTNDGHNWRVEPIEWVEGDYGLIIDGTFFVSNDMMVKVLQGEGIPLTSVLIKAPFTQWQPKPMTLQDGYWVYKAL